jgi:hypothetical protein
MGAPGISSKAVSQLLWSEKDREVWFSLKENHEKAGGFGLHQLRNSLSEEGKPVIELHG